MSTKKLSRVGLVLLLLGWVIVIFIFSSQSYSKQSILPFLHHHFSEKTATKLLPHIDFYYFHHEYSNEKRPFDLIEFIFRKGAHLFMYAILAILSAVVLPFRQRIEYRIVVPLVIVGAVATIDEWNQKSSIGRTSNPKDVVIDIIGGGLGLLAYLICRRRAG